MAAKYPEDGFANKGCCCSICFEEYKDPRVLKCIHTFCQECIQQYIMKKQQDVRKNGIDCPICRTFTRINLKDTPIKLLSMSLPVNFALKEALLTIRRLEQTRCAECSKKNSENTTFLCIECASKIRSQHKTPVHSSSDGLTSNFKQVPRCGLHNKKYKFYCFDEDNICCSKCAFKYHRRCKKVTELGEVEETWRLKCAEGLQNQVCTIKRKAKNARQFLTVKVYEMEKTCEEITFALQSVHKSAEKIQTQEILRNVTGLKVKDLSKYNLQLGKCSSLIDDLDNIDQLLIRVSKIHLTEEDFIALHDVKREVFECTGRLQEVFCDLTYTEITLETTLKSKTNFRNTTDCMYNLKTRRVNTNINDLSDYRIVTLHASSTRILRKTEEENVQPLLSGMAFLSDGRLAVCDNMNMKCVIFDTMLQKLGEIKFSSFVYGIAKTKDDEIFITSVRTLESLKIDENNCFTKPNSTKISSRADSLALSDNDNFVIGTFKSKVPVRIVSKDGKENDLDLEFPSKEWGLGKSKCTYDIKNKALVISDRSCDTLYIYNLDKGKNYKVFSERLKEPSGVAFGPADCIFVCSEDTDSIVQVTITGELLKSHKLDLISPCTLAFSADRSKLAVTNNNNEMRKLQIFDVVFFSQ